MPEFTAFTDLAFLGTVAGATATASLVVTSAKRVFDGTRRTWRAIALLSSVTAIQTALVVGGTWTAETAVLGLLNGLIAGVASMGLYDLSSKPVQTKPQT
jgi:hypothetical protein